MYIMLFVSLVAIFVGLFYVICNNNNKYLSRVPKPPSNLLLGHILDLREPSKILEKFKDYTLTFGGIIRIYTPHLKPAVVVTDPKIIQRLLTSDESLDKATYYKYLRPWLGTGLITSDTLKWRSRRKLLSPCFGRTKLLREFTEVFESFGDILIGNLKGELDNNSVDLLPLMKMYTMDVLCETAMGPSLNFPRNVHRKYVLSIEKMSNILIKKMTSPFKRFDWLFRLTKDYVEQTEALKIIDRFLQDIKSQRISKLASEEANEKDEPTNLAFLDTILLYEKDGVKLNEEDFKEEVNTFIFAGHDTIATALSFTLYCLARHQDIQEKVMDEQKHIFGLKNDVAITYADLQDMKYLEMVINESLRLYPPVHTAGRRLTSDLEIDGGIILPKNISVLVFIYGCHHNPKYFPEPEKFIPERFENDDILPFSHIPFLAGKRDCVGKKFAMLQIKGCISKIVRNFKLWPSKPDDELELIPEITLVAKNGVRISLEKRLIEQ